MASVASENHMNTHPILASCAISRSCARALFILTPYAVSENRGRTGHAFENSFLVLVNVGVSPKMLWHVTMEINVIDLPLLAEGFRTEFFHSCESTID